MPMVTLAEIAQQLGVSRGAISHVLNGRKAKVGQRTRRRIEDALQQNDYQPNRLARALKTRRSHTLGVIVPSVTFTFFPEIVDAIERAGQARGYQILIGQSHSTAAMFERQIRTLSQHRVDGLILALSGMGIEASEHLDEIATPMVVVDGRIDGADVSFVDVDDRAITTLATRHLLELGHRRIAYLGGLLVTTGPREAVERRAGYLDAMRGASLPPIEGRARQSEYSVDGGREAIDDLLASHQPFTAVVAPTDMAAIGALGALREAGRSVPQDVSIVGCGNLKEGQFVSPALTTISQQADEMGRRAADLLIDRIEQPEATAPSTLWLEPQLIVRQSTAAPPSAT